MFRITYEGNEYHCREGETLLDALVRQGAGIQFSCRNGVCHVCLQRCVGGELPPKAQRGLDPTLAEKGYFLPCKCVPHADLAIAPPRSADLYQPALLAAKEQLAPEVYRLLLEPSRVLNYRPGQFINVRRPDGTARSYSLASVPEDDYYLELQVRRMENGQMSTWLCDTLQVGEEVEIEGPNGSCFYSPHRLEQELLLIGTGTGLAPLLGIAKDALVRGHTGLIHLYHGSSYARGLYLNSELAQLSERYPNLHYTGCCSRETPPGIEYGRAHRVAFARHSDLRGWRVYIAGNPKMVAEAEVFARRAGAETAEIYADPFLLKDLRRRPEPLPVQAASRADNGTRLFKPDPEMWAALKEGELLTAILTDFYTRVFDDPVLSPYFRGVTRQRVIEKVYLFMRQIFTGEKVYFGDRPRNGHHWMVISDGIFDYREELMTRCMRRQGLPEHLIERWRGVEETFRRDIVKPAPRGRMIDGVELPVGGFDEAVLDEGALCDGCGAEVEAGRRVRYHLRLGTVYCQECGGTESASTVGSRPPV